MLKVSLNTAKLDALPKQLARLALEMTLVGATATAQDARQQVQNQIGSGEHYPGLPNQSSAPGEAPVNQTGGLLETIGTSQEDVVGIGADAVAGDGSGQALALEGGTSNMAPRPFMGPAAVAGEEAVQAMLPEIAARVGRE